MNNYIKVLFLLCIFVFTKSIAFSQDSLLNKTNDDKLLKNWPKKFIFFKQRSGDSNIVYRYDKKTTNIFEIRAWFTRSDTGYIFFFIDGELLKAVFSLRPNRRRDWKTYNFRFSNGKYMGKISSSVLHNLKIENVLIKSKYYYMLANKQFQYIKLR